jgi:hypothetical protein
MIETVFFSRSIAFLEATTILHSHPDDRDRHRPLLWR